MNQTQIRKLVKPNLTIIETANRTITINKWTVAKALYETHEMVNWQKTLYKGWTGFVQIEIPSMKLATTINYIHAYKKMLEFGYSWHAITRISQEVSFTAAKKLVGKLKKKLTVLEFIKEAKALVDSRKTSFIEHPNQINMWISDEHIAKFETLLEPYGMYKTAHARRGKLSQAFMDYLDDVI